MSVKVGSLLVAFLLSACAGPTQSPRFQIVEFTGVIETKLIGETEYKYAGIAMSRENADGLARKILDEICNDKAYPCNINEYFLSIRTSEANRCNFYFVNLNDLDKVKSASNGGHAMWTAEGTCKGGDIEVVDRSIL